MALPLKPGIYPGVTREEYDLLRQLRWSHLKYMVRSPAHFRWAAMQQDEDTDARKLGRVTHLATFEPEQYVSTVAVWDGGTRRGKDWDSFCAKHKGKEIVTEKMHEQAMAISQAARANKDAAPYLSGGMAELTVLWQRPEPLLFDCKARVDFVAEAGAIVDLKTCEDSGQDAFGRASWSYRYHTQAAWYVDGYELATGRRLPYVIVAVEKSPPHVVTVYRVKAADLRRGREEYVELLERLAHCRKANHWPGYADGEVELELPAWATNDDDESDPTGMGLEIEGAETHG
jgi:hypothetical protein